MIARPVSVREGPKSPIALGDVDLNVNARNVLGTSYSTPAFRPGRAWTVIVPVESAPPGPDAEGRGLRIHRHNGWVMSKGDYLGVWR
ncbi:hypothetical protein GCM10009525_60680 [Streptosporangium amethystogenes subsp. fukuiense]